MRIQFILIAVILSSWLGQASALPPRIITEPQDRTNLIASTVLLEASAEGSFPLRLQWRAYLGSSYTNVAGGTNRSLTLTNIEVTGRRFALFVTNDEGSTTSRLASVVVVRPPSFLTDPASTILVETSGLNLGVTASGTSPLRYQWFFEGRPLLGKVGQVLSVSSVSSKDEGDYYAVVTNAWGQATSRVARVRVTPSPFSLEERTFVGDPSLPLPYRLFIPEQGTGKTSPPYPLLLALHGAGERGTDNARQLSEWPQPLVFISYTNQSRFPLILVAPQCPEGTVWGGDVQTQLFGLIDSLVGEFPIDTNRIYVTGLSMGGFASWDLPTARPSLFAASVPIAGGGIPEDAGRLLHLPVWNFHAATDGVVSVDFSRSMVDAMRRSGGHTIYTEYADGGHAIWAQAWATPGLVEWVLSQRRGQIQRRDPRLQVTHPAYEGGVAVVASTNLTLSGTSQIFGEKLGGVTWSRAAQRGVGTVVAGNGWNIQNLAIKPDTTNTFMLLGSTYSFAPELGGSTTFNAFIQVEYVPALLLTAKRQVDRRIRLEWQGGGKGPFRLQMTRDVSTPAWTDVLFSVESPVELPAEDSLALYRLVSGGGGGLAP